MMDLEMTFTSLQYSFLDDYCRDPSFAYTMAVTDWREIETEDGRLQSIIRERMERAAAQLYGWRKGLVQMSSFHDSFGERQFGVILISWLRFTHRSILDYFNEPLINQRLFSVVGRSQLIEASSETLLTEFTVNGSVHRSIPDYSSSQWFAP